MKGRNFILLAALLTAMVCVPIDQGEISIRFPYQWLDSPGFGGDIDQQKIVEPSGICYHPARDSLFVASDEGRLYEIGTDGRPINSVDMPGDLEGVTVNPDTGLVYVISEGIDVIIEFDPESQTEKRRFPLNRRYGRDPFFIQKQDIEFDNGIECITFVPDPGHPEGGTFFIGNQWDPSVIIEVLIPIRSSRKKVDSARIIRVLPFRLDDPAAMYFDHRTRLLNVVSDADNILYELTLEGRLVRQYAFLGDNQEGLAIDHSGYLYITQDNGGILKVKDLRNTRQN